MKWRDEKIMLVVVYGVVLVGWAGYRWLIDWPEVVDEMIVKPVVWLVPVLVAMGVEKRNLGDLVSLGKGFWWQVGWGVIVGMGLVAAARVLRMDFGWERLGLVGLVVAMATALSEEWLFRGYLQPRLVKWWGRWKGMGVTTLLFVVIHGPLVVFRLRYDWMQMVTYGYLLGMMGMVYGVVKWRVGLWGAIVVHGMWNWMG